MRHIRLLQSYAKKRKKEVQVDLWMFVFLWSSCEMGSIEKISSVFLWSNPSFQRNEQNSVQSYVGNEIQVCQQWFFFASFGWPHNVRIEFWWDICVDKHLCNKWSDSLIDKRWSWIYFHYLKKRKWYPPFFLQKSFNPKEPLVDDMTISRR